MITEIARLPVAQGPCSAVLPTVHGCQYSFQTFPFFVSHCINLTKIQFSGGNNIGLEGMIRHKNVKRNKQSGSVSCSECLPLVTVINFIIIMVFGLGLGLCLSKSHAIFLLITHCRSLNKTIDFYIAFLSDSSSKFSNKCLTIPPIP